VEFVTNGEGTMGAATIIIRNINVGGRESCVSREDAALTP
jgi:hypothetical protein